MGLGLIIGGNGYVGSYLQKHLNCHVMDVGWYGSEVTESLCPADYDYVIMLAAHASIWLCEQEPATSWINNVDEFRRLIMQLPVGLPMIYASSGSVYGSTNRNAIEQDTPAAPLKQYDLQKLTIDLIAEHANQNGHRLMGLRFGTVNGIAEHTRTDVMINAMVNTALTDSRLEVGNMDKRRALLYLPDLLQAIQLILNRPIPGIYNLASTNATVGEIARQVSEQLEVPMLEKDFHNPYSFGLSCAKFVQRYGNYQITDTTRIIDDLATHLPYVRTSRRDELP